MRNYLNILFTFLLFILPNVNFAQIASPDVCIGTSLSLIDSVSGGTWNSSNTKVTISGSIVTGVAKGKDTISYIVSNMCGADTATIIVNVISLPDAGSISGLSTVMVGTVITIVDTTSSGTWSSSNLNASVSGGIIIGMTAGTDTITYTVSNACGADYTIKVITINPVPYAGTIVGANNLCVGSVITLTDTVGIGIWQSSNLNATILAGVVTGIMVGIDTIMYIVLNAGGIDTASLIITINPLPVIANITGPSGVCIGSVVTLSDAATGGSWSVSNSYATILGGIVYGTIAGIDTIRYIVSNMCGTGIATTTITINPLPVAGAITGFTTVSVGFSITLTDTSTLGQWSCSNSMATVFGGIVSGVSTGIDTIIYIVTNTCGSDTSSIIISIKPIPYAGFITGLSSVCVGSVITLTDNVSSGNWSASNSDATILGGLVTGIEAGLDTIRYIVTNLGGTDTATFVITINLAPAKPTITTIGPASVCTGTLFQNYGTNITAPVGISYSWNAINAIVWATGSYGQNVLVSFPNPGKATVILSANLFGTICESSDSVGIIVKNAEAIIPQVFYFQYNFICLPANLDAYQWGYDDVITLASTTIVGAINQDYQDANPDFANKYYWVNTNENECIQKTYYNAPLAIQNINNIGLTEMVVYPNPANEFINVIVNSTLKGKMILELINITGQKLSTTIVTENKTTINITGIPAGFYIVNCYYDGLIIATSRFIKD